MLTPEEEKFLVWWQGNRELEKSIFRKIGLGLRIGLVMGAALVANFMLGWYSRATMIANAQSTPYVLIVAIFIIAFGCSIFYKQHRWEMNEQRYQELTRKKHKNKGTVQQETTNNSQIQKTNNEN